MNAPAGVVGAAQDVQERLSGAGFRFCFIGGVALQRWGEPRYTQDVDLTLWCAFGEEITVARRLAGLLKPRFEGAVEFSAESRVFLAQATDGTPVDIAFGAIDFESRCLKRASPYDFGGGSSLVTCSAEDLIVMKVFAGRSRDWSDVEGIILRRGPSVDWDLVAGELKPLLALKEGEGALERLQQMRLRHCP